MIDVERGEQLLAYDNCSYNGKDSTNIATDPICPSVAVCVSHNGKGLTLFDLRMPLPIHFFYEVCKTMFFYFNFVEINLCWLTQKNKLAIIA